MTLSATTRLALAAVLGLAGLVALPGGEAHGGKGFVSKRKLRAVEDGGAEGAFGGIKLTLRVRGDGSVVQHLRAWVRGLPDPEDAVLWMAAPGSFDYEEVGAFAATVDGLARVELRHDTQRPAEFNDDLPAGVDTVLGLHRARVQVREVGDEDGFLPLMAGRVANFKYRNLDRRRGRRGTRSRRSRLRRPRPPQVLFDDDARGYVRLFRERRFDEEYGGHHQGFIVFTARLDQAEDYEVWVEDEFGEMQYETDITTTEKGQGLLELSTRNDDDLPLGVLDVLELAFRRVEIRYFGDDDPVLAGTLKRVR